MATFPGAVWAPDTIVDFVTEVDAAWGNPVQNEIVAIQNTLTGAITQGNFQFSSSDSTVLQLHYDSGSTNDEIILKFQADDDGGNVTTYGAVEGVIVENDDGGEDGAIRIQAASNGSLLDVALFQYNGLVINEDLNDIDFLIRGTTDAALFFVDAGNDRVGIGTASPSYKLHVSGTSQYPFAIHRDTNTKYQTVDMLFQMDDLNNDVFSYVRISATNATNSLGAERSDLDIYTYNNGVETRNTSYAWWGFVVNPDKNSGIDFNVLGDNDDYLIWGDSGNDAVTIGSTTELAKFGIDGNADEVQFCVQGHSTQTNLLVVLENSSGTDKLTITQEGIIDYRGTMGDSALDPASDAPADWIQVAIGGVSYYIPVWAAS